MVLTRSGSKLQPNNMENNEEAVNSEPRVGAQNTQTQVPTNNPPTLQTNTGTGGIVRSSSAPSIGSDASISPDELNNTILSPAFSSLTAQNVRREFRQGNGDDRSEFNQANNLQEMMAAIGLAQAQLMRSIEVIRQVQRDLQQARPTVRNSTEEGLSAEHAAGIQTPAIAPMTRAPPPLTRYPTVVENTQSMHGIREPPPSQAVRNEASGAENNNPIIAVDTRGQDYTGNPTEMRPQKPSNASSYHGNVAHQSSNRKYKVKDWGMRFNGSEKNADAEHFIFCLESTRQDYGYPFDELLREFPQLLEGSAESWYWQQRRIAPFRHWNELREAFLAQFRRYQNEFQIQKEIMGRRQMPNETFDEFFDAVLKMRNQQRSPYDENDLVEIMKGNLKSSLASLIFPIQIKGLNHFRQEVKRAELMVAGQRQAYQQRTFQPQKVHELEYTEAESELDVDALAVSNRYTCWNCRKVGHSYIDCPVPISKVFCFKCGREGVVSPKCPRCQGNLNRSVPRTGEARSTQTESQQEQ